MKDYSEHDKLEENIGIFLDLDVCQRAECESCETRCSYLYHSGNSGVDSIREEATFALYCRQCEEGACIEACPMDALERDEEGLLVRSNLLCIGCDSCEVACPFGTIRTDFVHFLTSRCDLCSDRGRPECVETCPYGALSTEKPEGDLEEWREIRKGIAARQTAWERELSEEGEEN